MHTFSNIQRVLRLARREGVLRPRDLARARLARVYLRRLEQRGLIERAGRGLYLVAGAEFGEHHTLAEACKRVPHAVVCLLSALRYHALTTQTPQDVWIAIDRSARRPRVDYPRLRVVHMSGVARTLGVERRRIEGVAMQVFSRAKTVVDCFKFRNRVGLDVALEALRDYRRRRGSMDDLWRIAEKCRMANVMRPYLEALS